MRRMQHQFRSFGYPQKSHDTTQMRMKTGMMPMPTMSPIDVADIPPDVVEPFRKRGARCASAGMLKIESVEISWFGGCESKCC